MTNLPVLGDGERNLLLSLEGRSASVGDGKISIQNADHAGWLKCDGRIATGALRSLLVNLGSPFGTSGGEPLLPNTGDRALVGAGATHALGSTFGQAAPTMPAHNTAGSTTSLDHTHNVGVGPFTAGFGMPALGGTRSGQVASDGVNGSIDHVHSVAAVGDATTGNFPPSLAFNVFIYAGI